MELLHPNKKAPIEDIVDIKKITMDSLFKNKTNVVNIQRLKVVMAIVALITSAIVNAQSTGRLYLSNAQNGKVYDISALNGPLPAAMVTYSPAASASNLAVGPNPSSTSTYVFTHSDTPSGSTVYVGTNSIGTTIPMQLGGLTANPATSGATAGYVYGISSTKHLIKASPALVSDLGAISGDAFWNGATVSNDAFFDANGAMYTVAISGSDKYIYKIDLSARTATQFVKLSGQLPANFQGLAFYNGKIYAVEGYSSGLLFPSFNAQIYEINPNNGQSAKKVSYTLSQSLLFADSDNLDLASSDAYTPTTAPTCNELFGSTAGNGSVTNVYRIDPATLSTTLVASGASTNPGQGNLAYGPTSGNLNQNQFVTSPNNTSGRIWIGVATSGSTDLKENLDQNTWGSPIGLGTDPSSGIVWGIAGKVLTKWTGSGDAVSVGVITGDTNWDSGTTLNDIAVDNSGNLYCIISVAASNVWLYRINPTTRVATPVVRFSGTYPIDLKTTNGNGLAYLGDYFYYSRINETKTDIWKLDAMTGISSKAGTGTVSGYAFGDLASCATVTNVPAAFTFDCGNTIGGIQGAKLLANGTSQSNILRIPITNAVNGLADITISGTGFSTSTTPYRVFVAQNATYIDLPITFNGSSPAGTRTITITSPQGASSCSMNVNVYVPITGTVFSDANGLSDATINGTGTNAGDALYAILYSNTAGKVTDGTLVAPDGTYSLAAGYNDNCTVYLTSTIATLGQAAVPTLTLPSSWNRVGEKLGSGAGTDGTPDGILALGTVTAAVTNANFGISPYDLAVTKSVNNNKPVPGNSVTFTLTAINNGATINTGVIVTDVLPSGYTYESSSTSTGAYDSGTGVWSIGSLNNGASATLIITAKVLETGAFNNTASISTTSGISDPVTSNNIAMTLVNIDSDGDGVADKDDLDDDNDGILDTDEGLISKTPDFSGLTTATTSGSTFVSGQIIDSNSSCVTDYSTSMSGLFSTYLTNSTVLQYSPVGDNQGNIALGIYANQPTAYNQVNLNFTQPVYVKIYNSNKTGAANGTTFGYFDDLDEWTLNTDQGAFNIVDATAFQSNLTVNNGTQIKFQNGTATNNATFDVRTTQPVTKLSLTFRSLNTSTSPNYSPIRIEVMVPADVDCDGIPNCLDLDSDGDACYDATEGDENILSSQLTSNRISGAVDANGVPVLVNSGGTADVGGDLGQGIGTSQNVSLQETASITTQPLASQALCPNATPTDLTVVATGSPALTYQWYKNTNNNTTEGTPIGGATTATYKPSTATAGTFYYYVIVTGSCGSATSNVSTVIVNPLPSATISGTTAVCQNATAPNITFTGSGGTSPYTFTYTINGGSNQTVTTSSGSSVTVSQSTGATGTFTYALVSVKDASSTTCSNTASGSVTITVNALPTAYSVTGGGSYCSGGSGVPVGLSGSQSGVSYQLQLNGSNSGASVAGTGSDISFGNQISAGTYTVVATNSTSGCSVTMTGSVTVSINPLPATPTVSSVMVSNTCPATTVNIAALVTPPSVGSSIMYKMTNDPNGADVTDPTKVGAGTYYIFYKNSSECSSYPATPVTVTIHSCNDLSITKAVSDMSPLVGSNVVFTITAFNGSTEAVTATEVKVFEKLTTHYEFKKYEATTGDGTYDSVNGIWTIGTLAPGGTAELKITATVK